ncbi:MAG: FmdB family zinc ribbon protein [Acidobacteriota bacterium]
MPLYEYRCEKCGNVFEVLQKYSDAPLTVHETCGGSVEKLISVAGLHFKGSGFYITDYSRGSAPASAPAKSDASAKAGAAESKPSDSSTTKSAETSSTPAPAATSTPAASTTKSD